MVNRYLRPEGDRSELTGQFIKILNQVGSSNTAQAQQMFSTIMQ